MKNRNELFKKFLSQIWMLRFSVGVEAECWREGDEELFVTSADSETIAAVVLLELTLAEALNRIYSNIKEMIVPWTIVIILDMKDSIFAHGIRTKWSKSDNGRDICMWRKRAPMLLIYFNIC